MTTATADPKTLYHPHGAALDLIRCRDEEILCEGPAGTGKSRACLEKAHLIAMRYDGARVLLTRKTRASMTESVLVTFEDKVLDQASRRKLDVLNGPTRGHRTTYEYPNGSRVVLAGLDKPEKIMSTEYDLAIVFEATEATEHDWEMVSTRLRNNVVPYQQAIADCNPASPGHWLNQRAGAGRMTRLLSRHEHNPELFDGSTWTDYGAKYLSRLDALSGPRRDRLRHGRWAAADGLVYDGWDAGVHLVDRFDVPDDWRRIRAIDFGYENPFVCQWWAIDGDGRMVLYRELYLTHTLVADAAKRIIELSRGESIEATVTDHDAEDRATLRAAGIATMGADKAVRLGIQRVAERLRPADDGRPRLVLMRDALVSADRSLAEAKRPTCTADEFDSYIWRRTNAGLKDEPEKSDDHGMDAMRYAVSYVDAGTRALELRVI
jgi:hypothetical protein